MAKKMRPVERDELSLVLTLSTGYEVPLKLGDVRAGLLHLGRALCGEVLLPVAKQTAQNQAKPSWDRPIEAVVVEIAKLIKGMGSAERDSLLHAVVFDVVCREMRRVDAVSSRNEKSAKSTSERRQ